MILSDHLDVLVAESQSTMRFPLRTLRSSIGVESAQFAVSAARALRRRHRANACFDHRMEPEGTDGAMALLRHVEQRGRNDGFAVHARKRIRRAHELSPPHPRLVAIREWLRELVKRCGIRPDRSRPAT